MAEPTTATDEELVQAVLQGREQAFAELVSRHKRRVFATASRFARDHHQQDDLAQEVFLRAYRHLAKFRGDAPFEHWLARLTVTACYDFLRKERRHRDSVALDEVDYELHDVSAENQTAARRARELLAFGMARLSADEQLILTLCELEERSIREVAALTGWSEANVKVRAFRARERLKKVLHESHE